MAAAQLQGMRVAILVTDDFEQSELTEPKKALEEAGATALVVSPRSGEIQGMRHDEKADRFRVDQVLAEADPIRNSLMPRCCREARSMRMPFGSSPRPRPSSQPSIGPENPSPSFAMGRGCLPPQSSCLDGR
jgi:DJ-1/PfpI family protein